jgi:hypothetical protein
VIFIQLINLRLLLRIKRNTEQNYREKYSFGMRYSIG